MPYEICLTQEIKAKNLTKPFHVNCDFDGTISNTDVIIAVVKHLNIKDYETIVSQIHSRQLSIKEGVALLMSRIPQEKIDSIKIFIKQNIHFRPGFLEFVQFCKSKKIKLDVTSGGIDFMLAELLDFKSSDYTIFCNRSHIEKNFIAVESLYENKNCQTCGVCKINFLNNDLYSEIVIGDSITDYYSARQADIVFATHSLIDLCEKNKIAYYPFTTFFNIIEVMEKWIK
jgi:2-hydroxy-3-keto-5-methylthiopentenyl-1-phosphate phosphatase